MHFRQALWALLQLRSLRLLTETGTSITLAGTSTMVDHVNDVHVLCICGNTFALIEVAFHACWVEKKFSVADAERVGAHPKHGSDPASLPPFSRSLAEIQASFTARFNLFLRTCV